MLIPRRGLLAAAAAAAAALALAARRLLRRRAYGGLDGVVSFSSRKIAAARAVESEEERPLVRDPLAAALAGAAALAAARARAAPAPPGTPGRRAKVGPMAVRTRWFDDQLAACLGMPPAAGTPAGDAGYVYDSAAEGSSSSPRPPPPRQVVVLGAGMDARPWRLPLPAGVAWFEVDRPDVAAAKAAALAAAGAELPAGGGGGGSAPEGSAAEAPAAHRFPLRAATWACVAADLARPGWAAALAAAGHDARAPTVWVAEGLLMYLEPAAVDALLRGAAAASARGSCLLALAVTEAVVGDVRAGRLGRGAGSLLAEWRWGCAADPAPALARAGWRLRLAATRAGMAAALGLDPAACAFPAGAGAEGAAPRSLFLAASLLPGGEGGKGGGGAAGGGQSEAS